MSQRLSVSLILGTVITFTLWELVGHWFLMAVPMGIRHGIDVVVGTALALTIAVVSIQALRRQHRELQELARLKDYLLRMQAHYLRLSPLARRAPRYQLEYQALEMKLVDVQQHFASASPQVRVSAIADLWELAQKSLPDPNERYPFFVRAISALTATLYVDKEPGVRRQALTTLEAMASFAREKDLRLLLHLIDDLAHANRIARDTFTEALARHCALRDGANDEHLKRLLPLLRFTTDERTTLAILRDVIASEPCQEAVQACRALQAAGSVQEPDDGQVLPQIQGAAACLQATIEALAQSLRALPMPSDFPPDADALKFWKRAVPLRLEACFLAGADLSKAQLQGANVEYACLQAATLINAQLQNADLSGANLRGARLLAAGLEGAKLYAANLQDADLSASHLTEADLGRTRLQGAYLIGADLQGTQLWQIQVADGKTKLQHPANFTEANWWDARFTDPLTDTADTEAQTWLKYSFPQPAPEPLASSETTSNAV